jgi:DHA1 family bicyclomycin/chloramphenicol resistance-like MFS transporter
MSLVALTIDTMLPALVTIGAELGVSNPNHNQYIISVFFFGLSLGQFLYGPLSDSIGRKLSVYLGVGVFMVGCVMSLLAESFTIMLAGRFLQGFGLASPRVISIALIRDRYEGRRMAQVMSYTMVLFIMVPVLAPALGQVMISLFNWQAIFVLLLALSATATLWLGIRLPETLPAAQRRPLSATHMLRAIVQVCTIRTTLGYSLAAGFIAGLFLAYLSTSPQILQVQYQLGDRFPLFFAMAALSIGMAAFVNGRLVMRLGMQLLSRWALWSFTGLTLLYSVPAYLYAGHPPLWSLMSYLMGALFCVGSLSANLNALAMQPLKHLAGVGAAVVGAFSSLLSLPLGILIGNLYDGTVMPVLAGFAGCSLAAIAVFSWAEGNTKNAA